MSTNLIELFKNTFGNTVVRQTSGSLGESAQSVSSSLESIVPSLLGAMVLKGNTEAGARDLIDFISGNALEDVTIDETGSPEARSSTEQLMTKGSEVLKYLVGNKLDPMIDWISGESGLKTSSASSLLKIVAPLMTGFVGRFVKERSLTDSGVKDLLLSQQEFVRHRTPQGLSELLGLSNPGSSVAASSANAERTGDTKPAPMGMSKFLPWLVLGIASLGLFYFLQKGCNAPPKSETPPVTEQPASSTTTSPTAEVPSASEKPAGSTSDSPPDGISAQGRVTPGTENMLTFTLPDGAKLNADPNTFTAVLAEYLNHKSRSGKCFAFDAVTFETGKDKLTQKSDQQLYHLLFILNAYPTMTIAINATSQAKATAIVKWLNTAGIALNRLVSNVKEGPNGTTDDWAEVCVKKR